MGSDILKVQLNAIESEQIQAFVDNHPHNTVFQSPVFFRFYQGLKNFKPFFIVYRNDAQEIEGVLLAVFIREGSGILSVMSSRCVVYGGPLVVDDNPEVLSTILESLNRFTGIKALFTQFRNFRSWPEESALVFNKHGYTLRDRLNLIVNITDINQTLAGFSSSRRRQLKKALQAGAEVKTASGIAEVRQLYNILNTLYREKVRKPLPSWTYFEKFFNTLVPSGNGIILLVKYREQIIGGIVSPITPTHTISELYVCGLDQEFPQLFPSVVATWGALEYGHSKGLQCFDFMGLGKPDVAYGVREFKLRFGGKQVNYGRFARRNNQLLYGIAELGYNILRQVRKI